MFVLSFAVPQWNSTQLVTDGKLRRNNSLPARDRPELQGSGDRDGSARDRVVGKTARTSTRHRQCAERGWRLTHDGPLMVRRGSVISARTITPARDTASSRVWPLLGAPVIERVKHVR